MHSFSSLRKVRTVAIGVFAMLALSACNECSDREVEEQRIQAAQFIAVNEKARNMAIEVSNCLNTPVPQRTVQQAAAAAPPSIVVQGQQGP